MPLQDIPSREVIEDLMNTLTYEALVLVLTQFKKPVRKGWLSAEEYSTICEYIRRRTKTFPKQGTPRRGPIFVLRLFNLSEGCSEQHMARVFKTFCKKTHAL